MKKYIDGSESKSAHEFSYSPTVREEELLSSVVKPHLLELMHEN